MANKANEQAVRTFTSIVSEERIPDAMLLAVPRRGGRYDLLLEESSEQMASGTLEGVLEWAFEHHALAVKVLDSARAYMKLEAEAHQWAEARCEALRCSGFGEV